MSGNGTTDVQIIVANLAGQTMTANDFLLGVPPGAAAAQAGFAAGPADASDRSVAMVMFSNDFAGPMHGANDVLIA